MDDQKVVDYFIVSGLEENATELKVTDETEAFARKAVKDPITDLAVINRTAGEVCPDGYTCLEETPSGYIADLNFGSFRCPQLFLCYRRSRDKLPLVHIGVLFEGRDKLLPNCELVAETPDGRSANVNNGSSNKTYIYFKRAIPAQSSPTDLVVTDVCIVIKDERAPHTFWKIGDRNLNNGLMGSDVFLCYKKAMVNRNFLTYQPGLLFRYPRQDDEALALPLDVSLFSMPMGVSLEAWPRGTNLPRPVFAKFVLTVSGNRSQVYSGGSKMVQKLYGAALSFYEAFPRDKLQPDQLEQLLKDLPEDQARDYVFYSNKSICLLSRWPFFDAFQTFLQHVLAMAFSPASHSVPIEKVILHLFHAVPFPSLTRPKVLIQLPSSPVPIALTRPDDSPIPSNGSSFSTVLKNLPAESCANLLLLALLEQKICLHSLRPDVLTAVAESVTSMVFPFVWQCPYVPLCPLGLCGLLHAPVPFIVGVDSRYFDLYEPPLDVIYVDLDTGSIDLPTDKRDLNLKMLPKKATKALIDKLEKITVKMLKEVAEMSLEKKRAKATPPSAIPGEREFKNRFRTRQFDTEIQEVFLHFMVSIMKGYRNFLKPMVSAPTAGSTDPASLFDVEGFLKSRDKTYQKFYEIFTRTQQFIRFIEERSIMSDREASYSMAFFDHCVERIERDGHNADIRLLEREGNLGDHTVFLPPLEPEKSGEKFTYGRAFPTLRADLLADSRSVSENQETNSAPDAVGRAGIPVGDLVTSRTKQEAKSSQAIAQHCNQRPKQWAKYLVSTGYAVWFMTLPSFVASSTSPSRTLRAAFDTLKRVLTARIQPADEVCYRIMIQLCGQYSQPALAVKVLFEMKTHRILPDAVTYGYYNKVVYESHWPSVAHSPEMLWMKVRHVVRGVHLFKQAGQRRRERLQGRTDQIDATENGEVQISGPLEAGYRSVARGDNKRDTGGSSDTGFFSLEHEDKRNSMVSLTSGDFLASIAELKPKDETTPTEPLPPSEDPDQLNPGGIVRRSRISSSGAIPKSDFCSAGLLMIAGNGKLLDNVFSDGKMTDKSGLKSHRRHRSLTDDPRRTKSPRFRRRRFSTSGLSSELAAVGKPNLRWKKDNSVTTVSLSTLPTAIQRVSTPITTVVYGTVEVLDEHVKTVEIRPPESDHDEDEARDKIEIKRRSGKSLSVPRDIDATDTENEDSIRLSHSTSTDFGTAIPKIGAFLRNAKSYSSIRKFWGSSDKKKTSTENLPHSGDASPLAKSGAALVSGMKSVTSALTKKFEEMATTLTTASPGSYSPSRAGSSLRDIPGALNFDYTDGLDDGPAMDTPEDDEDEYKGDAIDGPNGKRTWHFPTYSWSPRHMGRPEIGSAAAQNVLVHADVISLVLCQQCETVVYDEEIMAGWLPDESNLNTKCPYCATTFLPELSIALYEHWQDESQPGTESHLLDHRNSDCPFLGPLKSTRSSLLTIENMDSDSAPKTPLPNHDVTLTVDSGGGDAEVPTETPAAVSVDEQALPGQVPVTVVEKPGDLQLSRSSSSYGPISVCRVKRRLKVPYLSPLVLRKELETLVANDGAACLTDPGFSTLHAIIYWNLVWYCERLTLPQNFKGLLIEEEGMKLLTQLGHSTSLASRSRFVAISCRWDDPLLADETKRNLPMYIRFGSQPGSQSSNLDALGLDADKPVISHNLMVQMLMKIRDESDLLTPMKTFLHEEAKHAGPEEGHRSLYRELLFLTIRALDNDNIDKLAFDKVYKSSFNELRKDGDLMSVLQADDRPPSMTASWCRHAFRPLQL